MARRGGSRVSTRDKVRQRSQDRGHVGLVTAKKPSQPRRAISDDEVEHIHNASVMLLQDFGMEFMAPEAWDLMEPHGVIVDRETGHCKFPKDVLMEWVGKAPSQFTIHSRNPERSMHMGGDQTYFSFGTSAPFVSDMKEPRRSGNTKDFYRMVKLAHGLSTAATIGSYGVEPIDRPMETRHLDCVYDFLTLSDKSFRSYCIGEGRARDGIEMTAIAHGISLEEMSEGARLWSVLSVNSPLKLDDELIRGAIVMAKAGQAQVVSPVCFAGAMSPISFSGALVQANTEAIATIAFIQMVRPGAPVFYGDIVNPTDMRTGGPAMGAAETHNATLAASQMARHYGIPRRIINGCNACTSDAQAGYETALSLMTIQSSGADIVFSAHGLLDSALLSSFEKIIIDHEVIRMISQMSKGVDMSDIEEAVEAIKQVGPGGHFFASDHTLQRYEGAVMEPVLSDWSSYENWEVKGSVDTEQRAYKIWNDIVDHHQLPDLDDSRKEALKDYVERRRVEIVGPQA